MAAILLICNLLRSYDKDQRFKDLIRGDITPFPLVSKEGHAIGFLNLVFYHTVIGHLKSMLSLL